MGDQRNLILAVVISVTILLGWQLLFPAPEMVPPVDPAVSQEAGQMPGGDALPPVAPAHMAAPGGVMAPTPGMPAIIDRSQVIARVDRLLIDAPRLHGSISLKGARFDDLTLSNYREDLDKDSAPITLLSPTGARKAYFASFGWVAAPGTDTALPDDDSLWTADKDTLRPNDPVTLTWDNGQGLVFKRVVTLDNGYMFRIEQSVENRSDAPVSVLPYGLISRYETPETTGFYILHEGLLGVFDGTLEEVDYDDVRDDGQQRLQTTGGWLGITDKYWLTALVPNQTQPVAARFLYQLTDNTDRYQADFVGPMRTAQPGASVAAVQHLFAGAKEVDLLDDYAEVLEIDNFDLAIDFGWFYFLTKPLFIGLLFINKYLGNMGVAIIVLTLLIKLALYPLANTSYKAMSKMKKLQPEMKKLQERFKDDKVRLNQEMMTLYKNEKANPAAGCLPILVQIPVFFALYKVLFVTIEMRHAPFFGWIQDLSAPDPTSLFNLFGLIPWDPPAFMIIGVWPLIMGFSMYIQQKLNPAPTDPIQAKIFLFLPIVFTIMLAQFPAGLVIYWTINNVLSIAQQWYIMRSMGVKV